MPLSVEPKPVAKREKGAMFKRTEYDTQKKQLERMVDLYQQKQETSQETNLGDKVLDKRVYEYASKGKEQDVTGPEKGSWFGSSRSRLSITTKEKQGAILGGAEALRATAGKGAISHGAATTPYGGAVVTREVQGTVL